MNTALSTQQPARRSALVTMATRLNVEEGSLIKTLKETVCKGCSDSELMAFSVVANEYGLNPFIKQIYAFPAKGGGIVPVVSIDGWVHMVNSHPQMDGMEFDYHRAEGGKLEAVTCTIWRKDRTRAIKVTEQLDECRRNTEPWKMENRMLRHKALMQCARYAFGFSGIVDEDEGEDMRNVTPQPAGAPRPVNPNPFADPVDVATAPAAPAAKEPASEPAEKLPSRDELTLAIRTAIGEAGLKTGEAFNIFHKAGVISTAVPQDTTDAELFAITQRLDLIPAKAKEEKAATPSVEAAAEPEKKTAVKRKDDALASIAESLATGFDEVIPMDKFEEMLRRQHLLAKASKLKSLDVEKVENIAGSIASIIEADAKEGGAA